MFITNKKNTSQNHLINIIVMNKNNTLITSTIPIKELEIDELICRNNDEEMSELWDSSSKGMKISTNYNYNLLWKFINEYGYVDAMVDEGKIDLTLLNDEEYENLKDEVSSNSNYVFDKIRSEDEELALGRKLGLMMSLNFKHFNWEYVENVLFVGESEWQRFTYSAKNFNNSVKNQLDEVEGNILYKVDSDIDLLSGIIDGIEMNDELKYCLLKRLVNDFAEFQLGDDDIESNRSLFDDSHIAFDSKLDNYEESLLCDRIRVFCDYLYEKGFVSLLFRKDSDGKNIRNWGLDLYKGYVDESNRRLFDGFIATLIVNRLKVLSMPIKLNEDYVDVIDTFNTNPSASCIDVLTDIQYKVNHFIELMGYKNDSVLLFNNYENGLSDVRIEFVHIENSIFNKNWISKEELQLEYDEFVMQRENLVSTSNKLFELDDERKN